MITTGSRKINFQLILSTVLLIILTVACEKEEVIPDNTIGGFHISNPYQWPTSAPEEQGFDRKSLDRALVEAEGKDYLYSLLIVRNGRLVVEEYYNGGHQNIATHIHSATKSFISALIGIAIQQGHISDLDQKFIDFFPEYSYLSRHYDDKGDITIRHLLLMRAGYPEDLQGELAQQWAVQEDWIEFAISLPLQSDPGDRWSYSSLSSHLLSAILTRATQRSTFEFAVQYLFQPLNIQMPYWQKDPSGYHIGGWSIHLTPRDMARFGYLYLNRGTLDGRLIIDKDWVHHSTVGHSYCPWPSEEFQDLKYAYHWWTASVDEYELYMAQGKGGQNIIVLPELDMVIVTTVNADMTNYESWSQSTETFSFISNFVIPSILE